MRYFIRKKKQVDECDAMCDATPMVTDVDMDLNVGMGDAVPGKSGDRFDNILVYYPQQKKNKKAKIRKRKPRTTNG